MQPQGCRRSLKREDHRATEVHQPTLAPTRLVTGTVTLRAAAARVSTTRQMYMEAMEADTRGEAGMRLESTYEIAQVMRCRRTHIPPTILIPQPHPEGSQTGTTNLVPCRLSQDHGTEETDRKEASLWPSLAATSHQRRNRPLAPRASPWLAAAAAVAMRHSWLQDCPLLPSPSAFPEIRQPTLTRKKTWTRPTIQPDRSDGALSLP